MTSAALPGSSAAGTSRDLVFISYSHRDRDWLERLLTSLKVYTSVRPWADKYIEVGGKWWRDISAALSRSSVGVLLVSDYFLASDFIRSEELPKLLRAAEAREITLFAIPISASGYRAAPLADLQFAHSPEEPLDGLRVPKRNAAFALLAEKIAAAAEKAASPLRLRVRPERTAALPLAPVAEIGEVGALHGVPSQRRHHRRRPEYFIALKQALLSATDPAIGITGASPSAENIAIGLHGMGGIGKTVLAIDLVNDEEIRRAFRDGIFWLTLGQAIDPVQMQARLAGYLTGEAKAFATENEGRDQLRQLFEGKTCLLVLDDLWRPQDAWSFDVLGQRSRLLVTTRDADLLIPLGASEFPLGVPDEQTAIELLASFSGQARDALPAATRDVAESCGHLPLALAVAGAQIRGGAAWEDVLSALERGRLEFPGYGSIFTALQVSTDALAPSDRDRYLELAVFPEDADVPVETICTSWRHTGGMEPADSRELLRRLHRKALLIRSDDRRRISFHDLQHDFLRLNIPSLVEGHTALIEAYRAVAPLGWASGPDDGYFFQYLPQHLAEADRLDELKALLCDYDWLRAKLRATNVTAILADYDLIARDPNLTLVQQALRWSAPALLRDRSHLPGQLLGRLRGASGSVIEVLLEGAEQGPGRTWLRPPVASLKPPGGALRQILVGHTSAVNAVAFLPDGSRALSGSYDCTLRLWDLATGKSLRTFVGHTGGVTTVAVLTDGSHALSGSDDNTLRLWDLATGETRSILEGDTGWVSAVAVLPDCSRALSGSWDKTLRLWDLATGETSRILKGHTDPVSAVAVLADGHRALSGSWDNTLRLWDLATGEALLTLKGHAKSVRAVAVLPDGSRALSGSDDNTLRLWDLATGETRSILRTPEGDTGWVSAVAVLPDGSRALTGHGDNVVRLWDLTTGEIRPNLEGHIGWICGLAVLPDGSRALSGSDDNTLRLWDLATGATLRTLKGHAKSVRAVAVLPDGSRALSGSDDNTLRLWNLATGETLRTLEGHAKLVRAVAVLPDGSRALSGSDDNTLRLWDLATGETLRILEGHSMPVNAAAVLPDGSRALSGSGDNALRLWDLATGETLRTLKGHAYGVTSVAVLADESRALSGSEDRTLHLWDLATGETLRTLEGHTNFVSAVAALADGSRALSGSGDRTLRLWDLAIGECLAEYFADAAIRCVAFARSDLIVAGSADGRIHILEIRER